MGNSTIDMVAFASVEELAIVLGSSTKVLILIALSEEPASVGELCSQLDCEQSHISHNLANLRALNLVVAVRQKQSRVYSLTENAQVVCKAQRWSIVLQHGDGCVSMTVGAKVSIDGSNNCVVQVSDAVRKSSSPAR